jgi:hypothetical protein
MMSAAFSPASPNRVSLAEAFANAPGGRVLLCAFDLLELDGKDLMREPLEVRKSTTVCSPAPPGLAVDQHLAHPGDVGSGTPAPWAWRASLEAAGSRYVSGP